MSSFRKQNKKLYAEVIVLKVRYEIMSLGVNFVTPKEI